MSGICVQASLKRDDFKLDVRAGFAANAVTAILGGSGTGKSTLLRLIAGLEKPQSGRIGAGSEVWVDAAAGLHVPPQKRSIGFVFQDYALFDHMSVRSNIAYGVKGPRKHRVAEAEHWLARMHLTDLAERTTDTLSGGQRQRVAVARALAPNPDVLLLDEPFSAIDAHLKTQLMNGLRTVLTDKPRTVLMVTHALEDARHVADHIAIMAAGKLVRLGPAAEVIDNPLSYEAAVLTGWRNLLAVAWVSKNRLGGTWGALDLDRAAPLSAAWVGIRPERIRIESIPGAGLPATVRAVREIGPVREIECGLGDGSVLVLHKAWDAPVPAPGSRVGLVLPPENLRPLAEGRAIVFGDEAVNLCSGQLA